MKKDGGSAFTVGDQTSYEAQSGMDLRDWFAVQALAAMTNCFSYKGKECDAEVISKTAYEIADAMLKARETE